jgi:hypothetical protein
MLNKHTFDERGKIRTIFLGSYNVVIKSKSTETEPPHNEVKGSRGLVNCDVITKSTKQSSLEFPTEYVITIMLFSMSFYSMLSSIDELQKIHTETFHNF